MRPASDGTLEHVGEKDESPLQRPVGGSSKLTGRALDGCLGWSRCFDRRYTGGTDLGQMNHKQKKRVSGRMCGAGMVETLSRAG